MSAELTAKLSAAVTEPNLMIHLDHNWLGEHQPLIRLCKPGATARSKPVDLLGAVIVGQTTHSAMLRDLADMLEQAGR